MVVKLNKLGVGELLRDSAILSVCEKQAEAVANRAGGDYSARKVSKSTRDLYEVYPATAEAVHENYKNNTLVKALGL